MMNEKNGGRSSTKKIKPKLDKYERMQVGLWPRQEEINGKSGNF